MEHNMILSASGWRKVFALSQDEQDTKAEISENDKKISIVAASVFFDYLSNLTKEKNPVIALAYDTRPTGPAIAEAMLKALIAKGAIIQFSAISSAPEIMAYARKLDGFIYISASHNPIGHNGIKFGTNNGGVLEGKENAKLVKEFLSILEDENKLNQLVENALASSTSSLKEIYKLSDTAKFNALHSYKEFINQTICDTENKEHQKDFFQMLESQFQEEKIGIVCDFNGSSRGKSIDESFFKEREINFYFINKDKIVHEIIPEAENLVYLAEEMTRLQKEGHKDALLGYMPDCDGDRGNIVYWDEENKKAVVLKAQEVFSLSVLAELTYNIWQHEGEKDFRPAVCVNCPTSMRIDQIAEKLGAKVFRSEVGEANVVNLAKEKRAEGYTVRILGEGSNGGTITYPSSVRDPLNTIFAIIKLLKMKENGLFQMWCEKSKIPYKEDFTLSDIIKTLPIYTTTGVSEERAILKIKNTDHSKLKANFQQVLEKEWKEKKSELNKKYGISSYSAIITNGTKEKIDVKDFSLSEKGGLKILFKDSQENPLAFIWMRGSGTEAVFRIMCDVKGDNPQMEKELLEWERQLIEKADK